MENALDLSILNTGYDDPVIAFARCGSDIAVERIPCAVLQALSDFRTRIERSILGLETAPQAKELQDYGKALFDFTVRDGVKELYLRLPQNSIVRIHILCNRPEVQSLPWEYLQEPGSLPGPRKQRPIVRIVPTIGVSVPEPLSLKGKIRVLFVSADPSDQEAVSWPEVEASILHAFKTTLKSEIGDAKFEFAAIEGANRTTLRQELQNRSYDVLHFSGHGVVENGVGQLVLHNRKTKKSEFLSSELLGSLLSGRGLRLVVLSACQTATGNFETKFAVIAETLVKAGIPAVVANQFPVYDTTAALFVSRLYGELLNSGDIDAAVSEGRMALWLDLQATNAATLEWGIPTIYRQIKGAQVFQR